MKSKMVDIRYPVLLTFAFLTLSPAKAQMNIAFYPLEEQFNAYSFNPAFLNPQNRFTFSIFPLAGIGIGYNNQEAVKQLVTKFLQGNTTDQDYRDLLQSLANRSTFNQTLETTLLTFSYKSSLGNFNFRIRENENFSIAMKGNLTNFVFKDGIQQAEVGVPQDLPAQGIHYREYSVGYSLPEKNRKFTAGIRAKLYFGKGAFSSGLSGIIKKDAANYLLHASGKILISVPEVNSVNPDGSVNSASYFGGSKTFAYLMNRGNTGVGIDLGFKYEPTPDLSFSASVTDVGKINWKTNLNSKNLSGEYPISESTVTSFNSTSGRVFITKINGNGAIADSITNLFAIDYDHSPFTLRMPVSIYSGIKYRLSPSVNLNFTNRYLVLKNMNYNSLAVTSDVEVSRHLSVNAGYAMISNSWFNIPVAVLFKSEFGQIYAGTDNLAAFFAPSVSEFAGFSFGMCFNLFRKNETPENYSKYFPFFKHRRIRSDSNGLLIGESAD